MSPADAFLSGKPCMLELQAEVAMLFTEHNFNLKKQQADKL